MFFEEKHEVAGRRAAGARDQAEYNPFALYRRKTTKKKRFIYYCQFRDAHGRRMTAVSTGKTTKAEATQWALQQVEKGSIYRKKPPQFGEYSRNGWQLLPDYASFEFTDDMLNNTGDSVVSRVMKLKGDMEDLQKYIKT